jgi:phage replication-related protein YjqB (UPF0714/DUF867 family)
MITDKYRNFADLSGSERLEKDFRIRLRERPGGIAIIAPHGGDIEPGTSEIAEAVAGNEHSFYAFEGIKPGRNRDLHITSTRFDEPRCTSLVMAAGRVIAIHGAEGGRETVFLGGLDETILRRLHDSFTDMGISVKRHRPTMQGIAEANVCNRARSHCGVQLEVSRGLRRTFFDSLSREGRESKTMHFDKFIAAVRAGIVVL